MIFFHREMTARRMVKRTTTTPATVGQRGNFITESVYKQMNYFITESYDTVGFQCKRRVFFLLSQNLTQNFSG